MHQPSKALQHLRNGDVIIYPSESCYSFGCDAKNKEAVEKIHEIKHEGNDKAFILNVNDLIQLKDFGILNDVAIALCTHFMPGALTLIIDKKEKYPHLSTDGIAFRILSNETARTLAKEFGSALVTTSVNLHGEKPLYTISDVKKQFGHHVSYIIDKGDLKETVQQSTIFDTRTNTVLREGALTSKEIYDFLKNE